MGSRNAGKRHVHKPGTQVGLEQTNAFLQIQKAMALKGGAYPAKLREEADR